MPHPPKYSVVLTRADYAILEGIVKKHERIDTRISYRAEIIIMAGRGFTDDEIAAKLHVGKNTVYWWRKRWNDNEFKHMTFEERLSYAGTTLRAKARSKRRMFNIGSERD